MTTDTEPRHSIYLEPGEGRTHSMGPMSAIFKADGNETSGNYTISEWWLEPHSCASTQC